MRLPVAGWTGDARPLPLPRRTAAGRRRNVGIGARGVVRWTAHAECDSDGVGALESVPPTIEHFAPLFVALGASGDPEQVPAQVIDGYRMGLAKRSLELA